MSNYDRNQSPAAASTAPQPVPAAAPRDKPLNPPIAEPSDKVNRPTPARTGGNK
jgi:hypothetical protein